MASKRDKWNKLNPSCSAVGNVISDQPEYPRKATPGSFPHPGLHPTMPPKTSFTFLDPFHALFLHWFLWEGRSQIPTGSLFSLSVLFELVSKILILFLLIVIAKVFITVMTVVVIFLTFDIFFMLHFLGTHVIP